MAVTDTGFLNSPFSNQPTNLREPDRTPDALAGIVAAIAARPEDWVGRIRLRENRRWYERLYQDSDHDVWLISWLPGQATGFHDHGLSAGALVVALGVLEEQRPGEQACSLPAGASRTFGPDYTHDVRNTSSAPAVSIHAYSPPLTEMNGYELEGSQLIPRQALWQRLQADDPDSQDAKSQDPKRQDPKRQDPKQQTREVAGASRTPSIEQVLEAARFRLRRLTPEQAFAAASQNRGVLVDIRPEAQRRREGEIPGSIIIERNVLEWRLDPASSARLPIATGHDLGIIIFCSEGYASSLAAAALQDLGLWRATDMAGGFQAWRESGLPTLNKGSSP